jgi:hypothetical protein
VSLTALLIVLTLQASAPVKSPGPDGTTALEQALIEHACRAKLPGVAGEDAYRECLGTRLQSLRADFGRDLTRVSAPDRKTLDAACSRKRQAEGREAYLECLTVQLVSIRNRRSSANPAASDETAPPAPPEIVQPGRLSPPQSETSSSRAPLWIGGTLAALAAVGGGALMLVRRRRITRKCLVCGADVPESGELCPTCRHEAALALRRAAAERVDRERAELEEQHRQSGREEELHRRRAREEEEARLQQQQEDAARRREEEARRQKEEEESRQRNRASVDAEDAVDPYAVLGVPRDASKAAIDAARQEAHLKYAPEQVAHLGPELQEHYKRKAEAVEQAYRKLTE